MLSILTRLRVQTAKPSLKAKVDSSLSLIMAKVSSSKVLSKEEVSRNVVEKIAEETFSSASDTEVVPSKQLTASLRKPTNRRP